MKIAIKLSLKVSVSFTKRMDKDETNSRNSVCVTYKLSRKVKVRDALSEWDWGRVVHIMPA